MPADEKCFDARVYSSGTEVTGFVPAPGDEGKPMTIIGTNSIRAGLDATCLQQAINADSATGCDRSRPQSRRAHGAPVDLMLSSPTYNLSQPGRPQTLRG